MVAVSSSSARSWRDDHASLRSDWKSRHRMLSDADTPCWVLRVARFNGRCIDDLRLVPVRVRAVKG